MAVYCLMFRDPGLKKLIPSKMEIETYTTDIVKIIGMCYFYLVHPDSKKLMKAMFFVMKENGTILLSCRTTMELGLIKPHACLDYLPPKARLLTSTCDQPSKTKLYKLTIQCTQERANFSMKTAPQQNTISHPQLHQNVSQFPGEPYKIQLYPKVSPKQTPCRPVPIHLKQAFKAEIDKMLKASVLKPVHEATPWINSFILVKGNDQHGQPKLCICLDPTNLNKAIVQEPYHFKTPEDIAHLLADATVLTVLDCKKAPAIR